MKNIMGIVDGEPVVVAGESVGVRLIRDRCFCSGCGRVFAEEYEFELHRQGSFPVRTCADPEEIGLILDPVKGWRGLTQREYKREMRKLRG